MLVEIRDGQQARSVAWHLSAWQCVSVSVTNKFSFMCHLVRVWGYREDVIAMDSRYYM